MTECVDKEKEQKIESSNNEEKIENSDKTWTDELKVGDKLDVQDNDENWSICKILEINKEKHQIKVHYEGWHKKYDQWIDIMYKTDQSENVKNNKKYETEDEKLNNTKIAAAEKHQKNVNKLNSNEITKQYAMLNTYTPKCEYLKKPKKLQHTNNSNIVYYGCCITTKRKRYLIITEDKFVYKYDISNELKMRWIPFVSYPDKFIAINNGNILGISNDDQDILYIFGGKNGCFGTLNLKNGEWNILCSNNLNDADNFNKYGIKCIWSPTMYWLNNNDLHIFGNSLESQPDSHYKSLIKTESIVYHIKYDKKENKFINISNSKMAGYQHLNNGKIIYIEYLNRLINFSGKQDIYFCDDLNIFKWYKSDIKLPGYSAQYFVVHICQYLVFVLYFFTKNNKEIWILDINENNNNDKNRWYKSNKKCPTIDMRAKPHIINTMDGWLHFIGGNKYHFKLLIHDIIPNKLHNKYDIITDRVINGYVKFIEKEYKLFTAFNKDLIKLIKIYYPKFGI